MRRLEKFGNLGPYPEGASFPKLMEWHFDNGTRPHVKPGERGEVWTKAEFARELPVKDKGDPARNVSNWVNGKNKPGNDHLVDIKYALFGDKLEYKTWRDDLDNAYRVWPYARSAAGAIPSPPLHFMGRDEDIATLLEVLLGTTPTRAILVRGGPGIGKSSLTRAICNHNDVIEHFGEARRWFVELDTASTAVAMEDAIARAIGLDPANGFKATLAGLRQRPGLLVLDNLETPWDPQGERTRTEASVAAIAAIPNVAVLASFRGGPQPFRWLNWTLVHPVERLKPPFDRQLFQRTAANSFEGDQHLTRFQTVLEGIPLAIELVALRAHGRSSLGPLWEQWKTVGAELASDPDYSSIPDRLTSLPHSIELSLRSKRMTEGAFRLFRLLGQLPAGLVDEDRDELLRESTGGFNAGDALLRIGLAVERSGRLDLLSPIREYALRRHPPSPADQAAWPAHYLALTQSKGEVIGTMEGGGAMARLVPEFANIEAAFHTLIASKRREEAMKALPGFGRLTYIGSLPTSVLTELAAACRIAGDVLGEANCIQGLGDIALARTDHEGARKAYEEAMPLYRAAADFGGQAKCISRLGDIALARTEHQAARKAYEEALPLCRRAGSVLGEANCIKGLGDIALARTEHEAARKAYEEAKPLYRAASSVIGEANCILSLGHIALRRMDYGAARQAYDEALPLYQKAGDVLGEANCIEGLGDVALRCMENETARRAYEAALPLFRNAGDILGEANCIKGLGDIAMARTDDDGARQAYEEALPLYRNYGSVSGEANCIFSLGEIALRRMDHKAARQAYEVLLPLKDRTRPPWLNGLR